MQQLNAWQLVDAELDLIEKDDMPALVDVFLRHRNAPLVVGGRRSRVNISNFSQRVGVPRHTFDRWVKTLETQYKETA